MICTTCDAVLRRDTPDSLPYDVESGSIYCHHTGDHHTLHANEARRTFPEDEAWLEGWLAEHGDRASLFAKKGYARDGRGVLFYADEDDEFPGCTGIWGYAPSATAAAAAHSEWLRKAIVQLTTVYDPITEGVVMVDEGKGGRCRIFRIRFGE